MKLTFKVLRMARVNEGSHNVTFYPHLYPQMEWTILPLLPDAAHYPTLTSTHFSFPQRLGGWVGLGGWLHTEAVCPPKDGHPSQCQLTYSTAAGDRTRELRPLSRKLSALSSRPPTESSGSAEFSTEAELSWVTWQVRRRRVWSSTGAWRTERCSEADVFVGHGEWVGWLQLVECLSIGHRSETTVLWGQCPQVSSSRTSISSSNSNGGKGKRK